MSYLFSRSGEWDAVRWSRMPLRPGGAPTASANLQGDDGDDDDVDGDKADYDCNDFDD